MRLMPANSADGVPSVWTWGFGYMATALERCGRLLLLHGARRSQLSCRIGSVCRLAVFAAFAVACTFNTTGAAGVPEECQWQFQRQLSIDNRQDETLVDFPALVLLDDSRIEYNEAQPNGEDLRFYDASGNLLAHEIETWGSRSSVWVRVPQIGAVTSDGFITMRYGNPGASDGQNANEVWSNGYAGVWHLNAPPTIDLPDSTANGKSGSSSGGMTENALVAGQIGGALSFDGTDDFLSMGEHPSHEVVDMTLEAWVLMGSGTSWRTVVEHARATANWYGLWKNDGDFRIHFIWGLGEATTSTNQITRDEWAYIAGVYDSASSTARIHIDGVRDRLETDAVSPIPTPGPLQVGSINPGDEYFDGDIDEVRISNVARSEAWIAAQHSSMTDAFIEFGDVETVDCNQ